MNTVHDNHMCILKIISQIIVNMFQEWFTYQVKYKIKFVVW